MKDHIAARLRNHRLYADFQWIENRLRAHQFVCWLVGGAVRDFILGRDVVELDLVTDANTEAIKKIFKQVVLVGESFGVIKVQSPSGEIFDLATFREEADYTDGRRPSLVQSSIPTRDMRRRDFTINSLYWDDTAQRLHDFCGGLMDLSSGRLRAVGQAEVRFAEDYLRLLRLSRLAIQLGFSIESSTERAALEQCEKINLISGERIWIELCKLKSAAAWSRAREQVLFKRLTQNLLGLDIQQNSAVPNADNALLFLESHFPEHDLSGFLRQRLKVSRRELRVYSLYRHLRRLFNEGETSQLVFEIEKSELAMEAYADMKRSGLFAEDFIFECEEKLKFEGAPLLKAEEIIDLVPAHRLGEELKTIRIRQLNDRSWTKAQAVDYLRKKYADQEEKT